MIFFRLDIFELVDNFTYDDGDEAKGDDTFAREPFCIKVRSNMVAGNSKNILKSFNLSMPTLFLTFLSNKRSP